MRTNIDIDEELLARAHAVTGAATEQATIEAALRTLVRLREQQKILGLAGKVHWEGDLEESRRGHFPEDRAEP